MQIYLGLVWRGFNISLQLFSNRFPLSSAARVLTSWYSSFMSDFNIKCKSKCKIKKIYFVKFDLSYYNLELQHNMYRICVKYV